MTARSSKLFLFLVMAAAWISLRFGSAGARPRNVKVLANLTGWPLSDLFAMSNRNATCIS